MARTVYNSIKIINLPNPFYEDAHYYEIYENLLELYLQNHSDLFGGQAFHMSGPIDFCS